MDFLLRATRESKGKKKLKHIIILTCRSLAVVALILAVARPLTSSGLFGWGSSKVDTVILILDRSASMELDSADPSLTKREKIIQLTQESLNKIGNTKLVLIDSATAEAMPITSPSVLSEIAQTQATDTCANIPVLLNKALEYTLENSSGRTEIWLASDMQVSDWQLDNGQWSSIRQGLNTISDQTSLRVISLRNEPTNNLSSRIRKTQREGNELVLEIEILQTEHSNTQQIPLTVSLNGVPSTQQISLSGNSTLISQRLSLTGKSGYGYIQLPADSNLRDNTSFFAYGAQQPIHSAIVAPKGEAQYYLNLAAAPPGYAQQQSKTFSPSETIPLSSQSLVIWQAPLPDGDVKNQLLQFIKEGGCVAFFPPIHAGIETPNSFLDTSWGVVSKSAKGKYFIVNDWTRNDGPLRNGLDGTPIQVSKLKAIKRRDIVTNNTSLADWSDATPLLTRSIHGKGAAYFVSSIPDYTWSNLGDADVLLPLIQRLVQQGSERLGSEYNTTIGQLPSPLLLDLPRSRRLDSATSSNSLNTQFEAGVYRISERSIAINRPPQEASMEIVDNDQLGELLANTNYTLFEEESQTSSSIGRQLWQPLLIAMLLFMTLEAILCLNKKRVSPQSNTPLSL